MTAPDKSRPGAGPGTAGERTAEQGAARPFWETKTLAEMSHEEWESLCDGCGRCCMVKLMDDRSGEILHTAVVCRFLDLESCRCNHYPDRHVMEPNCVDVNADNVEKLGFMPASCAYRRIAEGRGLAWWHPLVSGDPETVHAAGVSVAGKVISEEGVHPEDLEYHVVRWVEG